MLFRFSARQGSLTWLRTWVTVKRGNGKTEKRVKGGKAEKRVKGGKKGKRRKKW